jgi:hypothetical protein
LDAHNAAAKVQSIEKQIEDNRFGSGQLHEFKHGQTNWPGPNDQTALVSMERRPIHSVAPNGQRFHKRQLFEI